MKAEFKDRKYITEFRQKLIEAGVDVAKRVELQFWLADALHERYQKGSDDAARIYRGELKKERV